RCRCPHAATPREYNASAVCGLGPEPPAPRTGAPLRTHHRSGSRPRHQCRHRPSPHLANECPMRQWPCRNTDGASPPRPSLRPPQPQAARQRCNTVATVREISAMSGGSTAHVIPVGVDIATLPEPIDPGMNGGAFEPTDRVTVDSPRVNGHATTLLTRP